MNIDEKDQMTQFLSELNELTNKHGVYISTLLDKNGQTKDHPYLIPVEGRDRYSGYQLNIESGEIVFVGC